MITLFLVNFFSFVDAGLGIKTTQESLVLSEGEEGCLTVGAYNPFDTDTNVIVEINDELKDVLSEQSVETKILPAGTTSDKAIPLKFCFKVPEVYHKDCYIAGKFVCESTCSEPLKVYDGEVILKSIPFDADLYGAGGSTTEVAVSRPLKVRVDCKVYSRNYTLVWVLVSLISAIVLATILIRKYRKPKVIRDKERLEKLKRQIAKEEGKSAKRNK